MKKEFFAAALLVMIAGCSLLNLAKLTSVADDISAAISEAEAMSAAGRWDDAEHAIDRAIAVWRENDSYTHSVLYHGEIDSLTEDIYSMMSAAASESAGGTYAAARLVKEHLDSMISMETPHLGSIF